MICHCPEHTVDGSELIGKPYQGDFYEILMVSQFRIALLQIVTHA